MPEVREGLGWWWWWCGGMKEREGVREGESWSQPRPSFPPSSLKILPLWCWLFCFKLARHCVVFKVIELCPELLIPPHCITKQDDICIKCVSLTHRLKGVTFDGKLDAFCFPQTMPRNRYRISATHLLCFQP